MVVYLKYYFLMKGGLYEKKYSVTNGREHGNCRKFV